MRADTTQLHFLHRIQDLQTGKHFFLERTSSNKTCLCFFGHSWNAFCDNLGRKKWFAMVYYGLLSFASASWPSEELDRQATSYTPIVYNSYVPDIVWLSKFSRAKCGPWISEAIVVAPTSSAQPVWSAFRPLALALLGSEPGPMPKPSKRNSKKQNLRLEKKHLKILKDSSSSFFDVFVWLHLKSPKNLKTKISWNIKVISTKNLVVNPLNYTDPVPPLKRGCRASKVTFSSVFVRPSGAWRAYEGRSGPIWCSSATAAKRNGCWMMAVVEDMYGYGIGKDQWIYSQISL